MEQLRLLINDPDNREIPSSLRPQSSLNLSKKTGTVLAETAAVFFSCATEGSQVQRDAAQWQWGSSPLQCVERSLSSL